MTRAMRRTRSVGRPITRAPVLSLVPSLVPSLVLSLVLSLVALFGCGSAAHAQPRAPVIQQRVQLDANQPVGFHVLMVPDTVYVGQQATYEMGVFISESAQQRMRRNPEVVPAELRGVLAYDLGGPQSLAPVRLEGQRIFPHVLQRALFPLASGRIVIPASQLSYSLPRTASYFSREEAAVVRARESSLFVKPLPTDGQPDDFLGAVGVITLRARVDAPSVQVGDPVVLTVSVGGRGNVKLWPRPNIEPSGASVVAAGERVRVDTTGQYVRGSKEFDWLVTPDRPGSLVIPVVEYAYFDPYADAYRVATSDTLLLAVDDGEIVRDAQPVEDQQVLPIRRSDRGALRAPLVEQPLVWLLAALAPIPALWRRRRRRVAPEAVPGRASFDVDEHATALARREASVSAMAAGAPARLAAARVRRQLLEALALRLDTAPAALAERRQLHRRLRRRGVTRESTADVMSLLNELDEAAWSPTGAPSVLSQPASASWADRIRALQERVDEEAMPTRSTVAEPAWKRRRPGGAATLRTLFALAGAALCVTFALLAVNRSTASARTSVWQSGASESPAVFADAVIAYEQRQFADAASMFTAIAAETPRSADALANAGTAAWAAHDTAGAVLGWQRALRLEPGDGELRRHLSRVGPRALQGVAAVPSVSRDVVFLTAIALWCLGCAILALKPKERAPLFGSPRPRDAAAFAMLALAVAGVGWQAVIGVQLRGSDLVVVTDREAMRIVPGTEAHAIGDASTGDVVERRESRIDAARGERWWAVQHADGRTGWLPERVMRPLR